jgi:hypothetical protein
MRCKICAAAAAAAFPGTMLKTYQIEYYRCPRCGFLQTEAPYWLEEAYASAISDLDLGPVNRAVGGSIIVESVIAAAFNPNARFIDWGGGYGVFTRLMRDKGYDFYWYDLYCQNLFAKQFAAAVDTGYELLTAFEVFEHLVEPMDEIAKMLKRSRSILFTTLLPPAKLTAQHEWWYLAPETGQHIAIYQLKTLQFIAKHFGLRLNTDGMGLHLLTDTDISDRRFSAVTGNRWVSWTVRRLGRRRLRQRSLLAQDFRAVTGWNV